MQKLRIYTVFSKIKSRPIAVGLLNVKRGHVRQADKAYRAGKITKAQYEDAMDKG